jgi:hypothetical protein
MRSERQYWARVVQDLHRDLTITAIAKICKVNRRTVCYWMQGRIPSGLIAVRLYQFHVKHTIEHVNSIK